MGLSRRKRIGFSLILACAVSALCLALLFAYYYARAREYYAATVFSFSGDSFIEDDPRIGYRQRASIRMSHDQDPRYEVYTDTRGSRVAGPGVRSPSRVDILAVGGSFTWGHGVADEQTFIKRVARRGGWTVSNFGLASYGMTASLLSLERNRDLRPRVVVYGFINDHVRRSLIPCAPSLSPLCRSVAFVDFDPEGEPFIHPPTRPTPDYYDYLEEVILKHEFGLTDVWWAMRRDVMRVSGTHQRSINEPYNPRASEVEERQKAVSFLLDQMIRVCTELDASLVVLYIPSSGPLSPELDRAVDSHRDNPRVRFVDVSTAYLTYAELHDREALYVAPDDHHPSPEAHRLIEEALYPIVASELAAVATSGKRHQ